ncbi:hypothetical protein SLEP1_g56572 [Rubroshorea leprosula]|uniref:Uncharacterized protein n=1 Tax=Rubroshorea leprosula TaxID=152421 RepID=A0AAV5MJY1_9ROSI|nr:hypothetical protein SLEP1_g56572 [Rubroshorea leprosula]
MSVQDRAVPKLPKSSKSQIRALPTINRKHHRIFEAKSLDLSTWVSDNFYKIVTRCILIFTVAAVFFLYNSTETVSFPRLQFKTQQSLDSISLPQIKWNLIATISDKSSPYANFRLEQWIVVSVSDYPSDSLKKMVKTQDWRMAAVGNWEFQDAQGWELERKSVGYLFAIQHGAKKIFDCDDLGDWRCDW